jgi:hypothetical protein
MALLLRFFDVELSLLTDSETVTALCKNLYARFLSQGSRDGDSQRVRCAAQATPWHEEGEPMTLVDGVEYPLPQSPLWAGEVCDLAVDTALGKMQSHVAFHAGGLCHQGHGIMLVGAAHHGKTTLTIELVRRGFGFLGDDIAVLGRRDRMLYPFPKSLRLWPDALERIGAGALAEQVPFWAGKYLVDIEMLHPGAVGGPAPLTDIILLRSADEDEGITPSGLERDLDVFLSGYDEQLLQAICGLESVYNVIALEIKGKQVLRVRADRLIETANQIQALCQQRGLAPLYIGKAIGERPSFDGQARLEVIPSRLAAIGLLRNVRGRIDLGGATGAQSGAGVRLFMELATLISPVRCHVLRLGQLSEMADLICGLVDQPNP